jgi:hypothetical protein
MSDPFAVQWITDTLSSQIVFFTRARIDQKARSNIGAVAYRWSGFGCFGKQS